MQWTMPSSVPFQGRSLTPVLVDGEGRVDDDVVVEAGEGGLQADEYLRAIEDGRWKLVYVPSEGHQRQRQKMSYELYEVRADPMETDNVAAEHPGLVRVLAETLERRLSEAGPVNTAPQQLPNYSEEELDNFRSLGYIR